MAPSIDGKSFSSIEWSMVEVEECSPMAEIDTRRGLAQGLEGLWRP